MGKTRLTQLAKEFESQIKNVTFSITECAFAPPGHLLREEDHDICIGWSFWIENGQISYPVSEITIAGNLENIFKSLIPADDLEFNFGINSPSLFIENLTVGGI